MHRIQQQLILLLILILGSACTNSTKSNSEIKADFYVSTEGSDTWSGTSANPNANKDDGPFATLERARDAVRELKKETSEDIVVGQEIKDWKKVTDLSGLPEAAAGNVWEAKVSNKFLTLFDDEGMLPRSQSKGFIAPDAKNSRNKIYFPEGELSNWSNVKDAEIVVRPHHAWITNILPVESIDLEENSATTTIDATYAMNHLHFIPEAKNVWVENVLNELDEPGEWVLNTEEGKVYVWKRNDSPIVAPILNELIRIEGKIDFDGPTDVPVRNLHFKGLTFKHAKRYQLTKTDKGLQHDWDMLDKDNAMLRLRGTENCVVEKCHFLHSGSGAIRVDLHGIENTISDNHIEHMGGGGILLCGYGPGTKDVNKKNVVSNNNIHHVGEVYWHSPGIFLWQSGENRVANNLIHHTDYTPIILSGCMSHFFMRKGRELTGTIRRHELTHLPKEVTRNDVLAYLHNRNNKIEYNEIHHGMLRMGDGNAIYIRASGEGNLIQRNYIHDMVGTTQMQAAIRTDGGQTGTMIRENLIYNCTSQGILTKLDNKVENNIVANIIAPPRGYYLSVREGPLTGASIQRNIFYSTSKIGRFIDELPPGKGRTSEDRRGRALAKVMDADTDNNIYFNTVDAEMGKALLEKNQKNGVDKNSLSVDPLFAENGDFTLKPDSPALKLGFIPIDISKAGLIKTKK